MKWPEEKESLTDANLSRGELFAYEDEPQRVYQLLHDGGGKKYVSLVHGEHHIHGHMYPCDPKRIVRRLRMIQSPKFEVI